MCKVLIFGGTTEGRILAEFCGNLGIDTLVSVATEYGASLLPGSVRIHCGRLDQSQMRDLLTQEHSTLVVDATHPYAREASENIRGACQLCRVPYLRLKRESGVIFGEAASDMEELAKKLDRMDGIILSTLGSKSLPDMAKIRGYRERLWVRILPVPESLRICRKLGILDAHIFAEKPPFSVEDNLAHIQRCGAAILVTKESGAAGGYLEKCEAARIAGISLLTLRRPSEKGLSLVDIKKRLEMEANYGG